MSAPQQEAGHIQVACRVRPPTKRELSAKHSHSHSHTHSGSCLRVDTLAHSVTSCKPHSSEEKVFQFDYCASGAVTQEQVFERVALGVTQRCLEGYNGTILCYGQTGTGKTYTMFGPMLSTRSVTHSHTAHCTDTQQGLIPRALAYLWSQSQSHPPTHSHTPSLTYPHTCTSKEATFSCSFYEIYQEKIFDLLDSNTTTPLTHSSSSGGLCVREDAKRGVFVEGCSECPIDSVAHAQSLLTQGYTRRHTGDTAMNRESSRSHAVFQIYMTITTTTSTTTLCEDENSVSECVSEQSISADDATVTSDPANSCHEDDETTTSPSSSPTHSLTRTHTRTHTSTSTQVVTSRLSMVDLAGSERVRDTEAAGGRLKEANLINKSLTALGKVINELSGECTSALTHSSTPQRERKKRHVSYRDSKLTFLLKDSLGGTARTVLLATVSAADSHYVESLSTLQFALRARGVTNTFTRQEGRECSSGSGTPAEQTVVSSLQAEVRQLRAKLARYSSGNLSSPPGIGSKKRNSLVLTTHTHSHTPRGKRNSLASGTPNKKLVDSLAKSPLQPLSTRTCTPPSSIVVVNAAASVSTPTHTHTQIPRSTSPFKKRSPIPLNFDLDGIDDKENSPVNSPVHSKSPLMKVTTAKPGVTRQKHSELQREYTTLQEEHTTLKQLHRDAEDQLQARDQEVEELKTEQRERREELEKLQYELAVAHEQSTGRFTHTKVLLNELEATNEKNKNFQIEVKSLLCSRDAMVQELDATNDINEKLSQQLIDVKEEKESALNKITELTELLKQANNTLHDLQSEVIATTILNESTQELVAEKDANDKLTKQLNDANKEKESVLSSNTELTDLLSKANNSQQVAKVEGEKFRTFNDIQGQDVATALAEIPSANTNTCNKHKESLPLKWMQSYSFSDSESDSCESVKTSDTVLKTPGTRTGTGTGKSDTCNQGVLRSSKECSSRRLSTDSACRKRKLSIGEESSNSQDECGTCDGTCDGTEVDVGDLEAYARDKIDNFSDSESESDLSGSECNSPVKTSTSTRRRKTLFTVDEDSYSYTCSPDEEVVDVIRSHGFYGSERSPLRAPDHKPVTSSGSFFTTLGKFFRSSSATTTLTATLTHKVSDATPLLASLSTAPQIPQNLQCHILNEDWQDGLAVLTWGEDSTHSHTHDAHVHAHAHAHVSAPVTESPYKRKSPQKKQKLCHDDNIQFEVQRTVAPGGTLDDEPDFTTAHTHTLATTTLTTFPLQLMECEVGSVMHFRVRAVDHTTSLKSLWSAVCSVMAPSAYYPSTTHSLKGPGDQQRVAVTASCSAVTNHVIPLGPSVEFGVNGVFNFLGTSGGSEEYVNPLTRGAVSVEVSCKWYQTDMTVYVERYPTTTQLQMEDYSRFCRPCSSLVLDLGADRRLQPCAYSLRGFLHRKTILHSWQLEASNDKHSTQWTVLLRHYNDVKSVHYSAKRGYAMGSWSLPHSLMHQQGFRYFRVYQMDPTAPNLECSGVELYGTLTERGTKQFRGVLVNDVYVPE